ncbi:hypothetical protein V8E36_008519, partial [Tilletia maclaganii]
MAETFKDLSLGQPMEDRNFYFEHGIELLQNLPPNSGLGAKLSDALMARLWADLPHPPAMDVGPEDRYRSADGSGNNPLWPELGKSGRPCSRSVAPVQPEAAAMPDPELVDDQELRRPVHAVRQRRGAAGLRPHPRERPHLARCHRERPHHDDAFPL